MGKEEVGHKNEMVYVALRLVYVWGRSGWWKFTFGLRLMRRIFTMWPGRSRRSSAIWLEWHKWRTDSAWRDVCAGLNGCLE